MLVTMVRGQYQRNLQKAKKTHWPFGLRCPHTRILHNKICISKLFVLISSAHVRPHQQEAVLFPCTCASAA